MCRTPRRPPGREGACFLCNRWPPWYPGPVVARPQSGLRVAQPAMLFLFPFPGQAQLLQHAARGSVGSPQGSAGSLHSRPPQSCFHVSDCFFPPWVAKQLMKKPLSFAFNFGERVQHCQFAKRLQQPLQDGGTSPRAPQEQGGGCPRTASPWEVASVSGGHMSIYPGFPLLRGGVYRFPPPRLP